MVDTLAAVRAKPIRGQDVLPTTSAILHDERCVDLRLLSLCWNDFGVQSVRESRGGKPMGSAPSLGYLSCDVRAKWTHKNSFNSDPSANLLNADPHTCPCTLEGEYVRLEPPRKEHVEALFDATRRLEWGWFLKPLHTIEQVETRVSEGLRAEETGEVYAFAVRLKESDRVVGSTSYFGVVVKDRRVEIGSTWYVSEVQGTKVNPECKYLLLAHEFEDWGAIRVQFTIDANNLHSQRAILKLGARFEGKLRNDRVRQDGSTRDSMIYSIIVDEWPEVREGLRARIQK
jgi:N-acetyltransferase